MSVQEESVDYSADSPPWAVDMQIEPQSSTYSLCDQLLKIREGDRAVTWESASGYDIYGEVPQQNFRVTCLTRRSHTSWSHCQK